MSVENSIVIGSGASIDDVKGREGVIIATPRIAVLEASTDGITLGTPNLKMHAPGGVSMGSYDTPRSLEPSRLAFSLSSDERLVVHALGRDGVLRYHEFDLYPVPTSVT